VFVTRESEVSHLDVQFLVQQNIFELEVPMDNIPFMHVAENINQLVHEKSTTIFTHGSHLITKVIKESTGDVFHQDVDQVLDEKITGKEITENG
jgi:hypothetical protein